jgi:small GTP-binding protein
MARKKRGKAPSMLKLLRVLDPPGWQARHRFLRKQIGLTNDRSRRDDLINELPRFANPSWSEDGKLLACPSIADGRVYIWDGENASLFRIIEANASHTYSASWSRDSQHLAISSNEGITVWDIKTGDLLRSLKSIDSVWSVAWSPTARYIIAGASGNCRENGDDAVRVWNLESGKQIWEAKTYRIWFRSVRFSQDGRRIASATGLHHVEPAVEIRRAVDGTLEARLQGHSFAVTDADWSADGRTLASSSEDKTICLWDTKTWKKKATLTGHTDQVSRISFSHDGRFLASKSVKGVLCLWRLADYQLIATLEEETEFSWLTGIEFHPNKLRLATVAEQDSIVRIWELNEEALTSFVPARHSSHYTNAKVVLVGEASTGKTCLARALMGQPFEPQESTHGMRVWHFQSDTLVTAASKQIVRETMLWDLAGQVDYQVVHQLFLDETALGIVMFDPTRPENPFGGVTHWEKALTRAAGENCPRLLVAGRVDRGHPAVTREDIEVFCEQHGYTEFIATSAKTGLGVQEVRQAIQRAIPWMKLPITSSPALWKQIRTYLLDRRASDEVLTQRTDLRKVFWQEHPRAEFSTAEFDTVIGHAQVQGLVWRLSFGDLVLLKPEILNDYAAAIVRAARKHHKGLGCILEQDVLQARVDFEDLNRVAEAVNEQSLLHAVVQLFLQRELALRESGQLVFPSKFNRQRPDIPEPLLRVVAYRFAGPIEEIYATLVVRLFYCGAFTLKDLWKNAAEYYDSLGNLCGFTLHESNEGQGAISVFFSTSTPDGSKVLFLRFIHKHLHQRSLPEAVNRERIYRCLDCGEEVRDHRAVQFRLSKGKTTIRCQFCETSIDLVDVLETKFTSPDLLGQIHEMEAEVAAKKSEAVGVAVAAAKQSVAEYDVFLAHNSIDAPRVEAIAKSLQLRGLNPWLDKEKIPPGRWFQDVIQQAIRNVKSAAIFIGSKGLGRWQVVELRTFISQCVDRGIPVIPVLLPDASAIPAELVFLKEFTLVRFSKGVDDTEALDNLEWGITGEHPRRRQE